MDESEIIKRYFLRANHDPNILVDIGDDAAIVDVSNNANLVITTDTLIAGVHFSHSSEPFDIGTKLITVNLSDVAAMGAVPKWATLNLTLVDADEQWLKEFSRGIFHYADRYGVALIGGDTCRGSQLNVAMQLMGEIPVNQMIKRSMAQAGDNVFVSGAIGAAGQALRVLYANNHNHDYLTKAQKTALYQPTPRLELGQALRGLANAMIDVSDGLLHDLGILCHSSQVGAKLMLEQIPLAEGVDLMKALGDGDDYELIFTVSQDNLAKLNALKDTLSCPISNIGEIDDSGAIQLLNNNQPINLPVKRGYDHFINS